MGPAHRDLLPDGVGHEKDGPARSGQTPQATLEHVSHVLDVHSGHYEELLADSKVVDEQLLACRCYRCSAPGPRLTGSRVSRKLQLHALPAFKVRSIGLAVCLRCNSRERVLPCDALPGKVTGAEIVLDAVSRLREGESLTAVAKASGVCRLSVQHWVAGLGARCLDLFGLLRHRALVTSTTSTGTLVRFAAFEAEVHRHRPALMPVWVGSRPSERTELVAAVWRLVDLVHGLGGTLATTQLGAALFRQAVLLFRSTPLDTSNFDASSSESPDTGAGQSGVPALDDSPPSQSQGYSPVALRPGREALATPTSDVRGPVVRAQARPPVLWPNGRTKAVSLATLYRWMALFRIGGLAALRPLRRRDAGKPRAKLAADVLRKAFSLLAGDPEMSYTFLLALLRADPQLRLAERGITLARSTLQRRLAADPAYARLKRARKLARRRSRYVGRHVHDSSCP